MHSIYRHVQGNLHHVPCLGHVINLAVQAILGPGGLDDEAPKEGDLYADDNEAEVAVGLLLTQQPTLTKLRKGIVKIRYCVHIYFLTQHECHFNYFEHLGILCSIVYLPYFIA
jgi:hypothetical protein